MLIHLKVSLETIIPLKLVMQSYVLNAKEVNDSGIYINYIHFYLELSLLLMQLIMQVLFIICRRIFPKMYLEQ